MPRSNIIRALEELNKKDIYSLILFILYRLKNISEYSILSELIYILDEASFARFLSYFEGQTIKVPKIQELKDIINTLIFYERKTNTLLSDEEIFQEIGVDKKDADKIYTTLNLISEIIKDYEFKEVPNDPVR